MNGLPSDYDKTAHQVAAALTAGFKNFLFREPAEIGESLWDSLGDPEECGIGITDATTYEDEGIMTPDAGLVLKDARGAEYQVTIVRSR